MIKETIDLPEGFLASQPWVIALALVGDHRIENLTMQRKADRKNYMWVHRSGEFYKDHQIVLFEYQRGRGHEHPEAFYKDFSGILVTDGLQQYLEHLLTVMPNILSPKKEDEPQKMPDRSGLEKLLPWSKDLPEKCRVKRR